VLYYRDVTREAELDRMKSEFLSTAAHELRTPMASIMGFSELLMMRKYDENKTRELLCTINRQAQRLTSLLTDLLDLARIEARRAESFRFETVPLEQAIDETVGAFLVPDDKHRIVLDLPARLPDIRMDRSKFQQALFNLFSNACKFSPAGGDVELSIRAEHPEGLAFIGVSVRDHGIGMDAEESSRAFERFYRTDRSGHIPGTGLGLALVHEIMKIHGGAVSLESQVDIGTCITLWFPLALTVVEPTPYASAPPQTPSLA
jgi:signal transduction histidine kinase